jgi:hypothetical protein
MRRTTSPDGRMKYFVLLVGIIGLVTYIFVSGPKSVTGAAVSMPDRREQVWDSIAQLEARRRDMLIMADLRLRASSPRTVWRSPRRAYGAGYSTGFRQGYFEGSFLAESRRPDPLFFPIPNP